MLTKFKIFEAKTRVKWYDKGKLTVDKDWKEEEPEKIMYKNYYECPECGEKWDEVGYYEGGMSDCPECDEEDIESWQSKLIRVYENKIFESKENLISIEDIIISCEDEKDFENKIKDIINGKKIGIYWSKNHENPVRKYEILDGCNNLRLSSTRFSLLKNCVKNAQGPLICFYINLNPIFSNDFIEIIEKKEPKRFFTENDPYGEEDWEINEQVGWYNKGKLSKIMNDVWWEEDKEDDEYVVDYKGDEILKKDAVWCEYDKAWCLRKDAIWVDYMRLFTTPLLEESIDIDPYNEEDWEDKKIPSKFLNHYRCPKCEYEWDDVWDAIPDDDCPECGLRHITPYETEDIYENHELDPYGEEDWEEIGIGEVLICINNKGRENRLTIGKKYKVLSTSIMFDSILIRVMTDKNLKEDFFGRRFKKIEKELSEQINIDVDPYGEEIWKEEELKIGDFVSVPEPIPGDWHRQPFKGQINCFKGGRAVVVDCDDYFYEIEPERLTKLYYEEF